MAPAASVYGDHYYSEERLSELVQGTVHRDRALELVDEESEAGSVEGAGQPVLVAVLDTGADMDDSSYPEGIFDREHSVHVGKGYREYSPIKKDRNGHGNVVTRKLIESVGGKDRAGKYIRIMEIDIFNKARRLNTDDYLCSGEIMAKGIRYAADKGAKVINISHSRTARPGSVFARKLNEAVNYAASKGCIVVTSAGNLPNNDKRYPACCGSAIAVMVCQNDWENPWSKKETVVHDSNFGQGRKLCAPGAGYTSIAAPVVAGTVALMKYLDPQLDTASARSILYDTATDLYKDGFDKKTGYGCVDTYGAICRVVGEKARYSGLDPVTFTVSSGDGGYLIEWDQLPGALKYSIYRADTPKGDYRLIKTVSAKSLSFEDRSVDPDKVYYYRMRAVGVADHRKSRSGASATIPAIPAIRTLPAGQAGWTDPIHLLSDPLWPGGRTAQIVGRH